MPRCQNSRLSVCCEHSIKQVETRKSFRVTNQLNDSKGRWVADSGGFICYVWALMCLKTRARYFLCSYGGVVVEHTEEDLRELLSRFNSYSDEILVVPESTRAYHLPILSYLKEHGSFVSVINPYLMKKYASLTLLKGKSDKQDAQKLPLTA